MVATAVSRNSGHSPPRSGGMSGPTVILGSHRSGTTVVAQILREMGLDFGRRVSPLVEDEQIASLQEWLLRRAGGSWEYPAPLRDLLEVEALRADALRVLRSHPAARRGQAHPWGWKDPRTVFTLGLWKDVYPTLQAIVVRRHPGDTAASLVARSRAQPSRGRSPFEPRSLGLRTRELFRPRTEQYSYRSVRCWDADAALAVWSEYNDAIDRNVVRHSIPVVCELHLEDLVSSPRETCDALARGVWGDDSTPRTARALQQVELRVPAPRYDLWPSEEAKRAVRAQALRYGYDI
jgi:hypothetical protein